MVRLEPLPIDDVLRMSDEMVVRRRFDARNRVSLFVLTCGALITAFFMMVVDPSGKNALDVYIGAVAFALSVFVLFFLRDLFRVERPDRKPGIWNVGRWLRDHTSAASITFLLVQYTLCLGYAHDGGWMGWASLFPFFILIFRLLPAELILIHVYLYAGAVFMTFVSGPGRSFWPSLISTAVINAIALGIGLWMSRGLRREVEADWAERRQYAREQVRMRDELQYARELQIAMLPECAPRLDWLDVCATSLPATEVGGDYYDYFVEDDRIALVCGDVAGHGLASGLVLASLRSGFTLLRASLGDPAHVLQRLHDLVAQTSRRRMLATAAVVLLDRTTRRATIASAGHPPVLIRSNGSVQALELFAPPLGVKLPVDIPQTQIDFAPGDVFVLHSDGIYESRNPADESYGMDRLAALVRDHEGASAESLRDAILADVERFRDGVAQDDDLTVVVARVV